MNSTARPIYEPWKVPFSSGGWLCDLCGHELGIDDKLGKYEGPVFKVLGYKCPSCGHTLRKEKILDTFNWKALNIGRISCQF